VGQAVSPSRAGRRSTSRSAGSAERKWKNREWLDKTALLRSSNRTVHGLRCLGERGSADGGRDGGRDAIESLSAAPRVCRYRQKGDRTLTGRTWPVGICRSPISQTSRGSLSPPTPTCRMHKRVSIPRALAPHCLNDVFSRQQSIQSPYESTSGWTKSGSSQVLSNEIDLSLLSLSAANTKRHTVGSIHS
jgi:hypothetical protein